MIEDLGDTIFAVASGTGRAGVAVVRMSGSRSRAIAEALAGSLPPPRQARLVRVVDPADGQLIDRGILLWFPGPASFTGEDSVEFQVHGSRAVLARLGEVLAASSGCRLAEPGEFTRRAFLNGKMDLAGVEGLAALVDAQTEVQRRHALAQLGGILTQRTEAWRARLLHALALVDAEIDFADEGDAPHDVRPALGALADGLKREIDAVLADRRGEIVREGVSVVIGGPPNAGKSTLLNALARRDVAIVSDVAGTTRDLLEVQLDLGGIAVVLVDTAGVREARDEIEAEGIRRARLRAESASIVLWLRSIDADAVPPPPDWPADRIIPVTTRADMQPGVRRAEGPTISARSGEGLEALVAAIRQRAEALVLPQEPAVIGTLRQRKALEAAVAALVRAQSALARAGLELVGEELGLAARHLAGITGRIGVEDVLGEIFARFCIGK